MIPVAEIYIVMQIQVLNVSLYILFLYATHFGGVYQECFYLLLALYGQFHIVFLNQGGRKNMNLFDKIRAKLKDFEVIGNIFDNPELLGGNGEDE